MTDDEQRYAEPSRVIERETQPHPPMPEQTQLLLALLSLQTRLGSLRATAGHPSFEELCFRLADESLATTILWMRQATSAEPKE